MRGQRVCSWLHVQLFSHILAYLKPLGLLVSMQILLDRLCGTAWPQQPQQAAYSSRCRPGQAALHALFLSFFRGPSNHSLPAFSSFPLLLSDAPTSVDIPVTMGEMLLRGCMLKNSKAIAGLVVYTGKETRIQMNAAKTPLKVGKCWRAPAWLYDVWQLGSVAHGILLAALLPARLYFATSDWAFFTPYAFPSLPPLRRLL